MLLCSVTNQHHSMTHVSEKNVPTYFLIGVGHIWTNFDRNW